MNSKDNDEERVLRIEQRIEQLQKDTVTPKHINAKVGEAMPPPKAPAATKGD
jgi:hypothetical protein